MAEEKTKTGFLGYLTQLMDRFSGDKVIFLIALFLMLISVVSVFSSTPRLVNEGHGIDRVSIMLDQLKVVAIGFVLIFSLYFFGKQDWFRWFSKLGFLVSLVMLFILVFNLNLGFVKAGSINGARPRQSGTQTQETRPICLAFSRSNAMSGSRSLATRLSKTASFRYCFSTPTSREGCR